MPPTWIPNFERTIENLNALPNHGAEKSVAEALNKISNPDVWVLHSLRYAIQREIGAAVNLEIDFLVVWRNRGFLILEVKGGRIDFDPKEAKWWLSPHNQPRRQYGRSPVKQVEGQKNDLCTEILPRFISREVNARSLVERVLVFPDVNMSGFKDGNGGRPRRVDDFEVESIVDRAQLATLASIVERKLEPCANYVRQLRIPGNVFENVVSFLRPPVRAEVPPQHILERAESGIRAATDEQKEHLNHVMGARWLLMEGPAGTAKTVLGLSAVLNWAENGASAYYVTANKYLVEGLRNDPRYAQVRGRIQSIREFLVFALDHTIVEGDEGLVGALSNWEFVNKGFSIVIDEVQDLSEELYECLVSLLPCERIWVLRDNRQSLERKNDERRYDLGPLKNAMPYSLTKNCRNTRQIAEYIKKNVRLPNGYVNDLLKFGIREPEEIFVASLIEQDTMVLQTIRQSVKAGHKQATIVVLSCLSDGPDAVRRKYCSQNGKATFCDMFSYGGKDPSKVAIFHALDFRGLESPLVVVTDVQDQESIFRASYLSGSRAKFMLVLIRVEDKQIREARESGIPEGLSFD
jgi:hypothetical protein